MEDPNYGNMTAKEMLEHIQKLREQTRAAFGYDDSGDWQKVTFNRTDRHARYYKVKPMFRLSPEHTREDAIRYLNEGYNVLSPDGEKVVGIV